MEFVWGTVVPSGWSCYTGGGAVRLHRLHLLMATTTTIYLNPQDPALRELEDRIGRQGRAGDGEPLTYANLVEGIVFQPRHPNNGATYSISIWSDVDRALIGEYLTYISEESYKAHKFLASAMVVSADKNQPKLPSDPFFTLARRLGAMKAKQDKTDFWIIELRKAQAYYKSTTDFRIVP